MHVYSNICVRKAACVPSNLCRTWHQSLPAAPEHCEAAKSSKTTWVCHCPHELRQNGTSATSPSVPSSAPKPQILVVWPHAQEPTIIARHACTRTHQLNMPHLFEFCRCAHWPTGHRSQSRVWRKQREWGAATWATRPCGRAVGRAWVHATCEQACMKTVGSV